MWWNYWASCEGSYIASLHGSIIIIIIIIERGRQCKAERASDLYTISLTTPAPQYEPIGWKKRKGKIIESVGNSDDNSWYITSNQQGPMVVQNLNMIVSMPNVTPGQIPYCTTDSIPIDLMFQENFPTNTQVWIRPRHRNDCGQRGVIWVTYRSYIQQQPVVHQSSGGQVLKPRAWVGPTTNWSQPETIEKSKAATARRFVVVDPNHSWWWPFKSPTNRKEARTSISLHGSHIDFSKQSKSR